MPTEREFPGLEGMPVVGPDWKKAANRENDYLVDREKQRQMESFTGIEGILTQDQAVTESMGGIYGRSDEHLAASDSMIIRTRRRMLDAVRALRDEGVTPPGADDPTVYRQRTGGVILPRDADWIAATSDLRKAFVEHPLCKTNEIEMDVPPMLFEIGVHTGKRALHDFTSLTP